MEVRPAAVPAREREEQRRGAQHGGEQHHQGGKPVGDQYDAEGRGPVSKPVHEGGGLAGVHGQDRGEEEQEKRGREADASLQAMPALVEEQHQAAGRQRQDYGEDDQLLADGAHWSVSCPSTWSVPVSPRAASSTTRSSAVVANAITIAVSTRACGNGSANRAGSGATPSDTACVSTGGSPARTHPMTKMKRFTA